VFTSKRNTPITVRALQKIITALAARAKIERIAVTAHTLRHTFARNYLQANPGNLVELAMLLGHESLDTTAIYTKASKQSLAEAVERSELNIYD
jgi:site-specific recombinase XerD